MSHAYYNENDPFAAAWLRKLIKAGLIALGEVDERSIEEVKPADLKGFTQCHFFAGIGVWSYALRNAGWPDDHPVWTGSCPCQSFSQSGKRGGFSDKRHLWPAWFRLIQECRPDVIFGEQVASKDGLAWLDVVSAGLEGEGYAVGATDLCVAGLGAPHIRQRLYFVADTSRGQFSEQVGEKEKRVRDAEISEVLNMGDAMQHRLQRWGLRSSEKSNQREVGSPDETNSNVDHPIGNRWTEGRNHDGENERIISNATGITNGFWRDAEWIYCRDEKYRPVKPGTFPLAYGTAARVGRLRGYGNALCAPVAQAFIEAWIKLRRKYAEV